MVRLIFILSMVIGFSAAAFAEDKDALYTRICHSDAIQNYKGFGANEIVQHILSGKAAFSKEELAAIVPDTQDEENRLRLLQIYQECVTYHVQRFYEVSGDHSELDKEAADLLQQVQTLTEKLSKEKLGEGDLPVHESLLKELQNLGAYKDLLMPDGTLDLSGRDNQDITALCALYDQGLGQHLGGLQNADFLQRSAEFQKICADAKKH